MAIDRERIIEEALSLLDEVGIDGLTTRRLAERLGVKQPALYWHYKSKSTLLDALNEEMLNRFHVHRLPQPGESWQDFTLLNARSFRAAMLAVRDGARLNAGTRPSLRQFRDAEAQLRLYVDAGFTPGQALGVSVTVARYVVGFVLEEQNELERDDERAGPPPEGLLDELAAFPTLSVALQPMVRSGMLNNEDMFENGLAYIIAGISAKGKA